MEMSSPIPQLVESFRKQKADYTCNSLAGGDSSNNREINRSVQTNREDKMGGHNDGELFMDNYCKVCCAMLISEVQRTTHYESKKHANKVRFYFQMHKEEGTPSKKLKTENVAVSFQDAGTGEVDKNKFCTLCNMVFTSPIVAQSHYQGKIHTKRLKQLTGEQPCIAQPQTVGTGDYLCAICNVTLNSIEQYQCHLQGYKHHLKENKVVNLVKNTKSKIYDSFQDELYDFIKVQKARGLVPKVSFRKCEDIPEEEERGVLPSGSPPPQSPEYPLEVMQGMPMANSSCFPGEQVFPTAADAEAVRWPPLPNDHPRDKCEQNNDLLIECYTEMPTHPENSPDPSSVEASDDSTGPSKKDKSGRKKKHRKEKRNKEAESKRECEHPSCRIEKSPEGPGLEQGKDQSKQKAEQKDKEEVLVLGREEKLKLKKEKKDVYQEKEEIKLKHKKQKKKKEVDLRTEDEKLWDESILGI
ncbi:zinc finger matrin-type protein 1-like isoform X3 [Scyliorhinus torazame]|uniref:zinc finger matrin-type protein 1-like isoform X3 n=1 Tax=Scyliorhinus torazame TaxID=75743 RepID=UPI003B5A47DB